jgi:4-oxalomesaconate tautomerase
MVPGAVGSDLAVVVPGSPRLAIEHPSGALGVEVELDATTTPPAVIRSWVVRTARKLFDGSVFPR